MWELEYRPGDIVWRIFPYVSEFLSQPSEQLARVSHDQVFAIVEPPVCWKGEGLKSFREISANLFLVAKILSLSSLADDCRTVTRWKGPPHLNNGKEFLNWKNFGITWPRYRLKNVKEHSWTCKNMLSLINEFIDPRIE